MKRRNNQRRIGIYAGVFNPVHAGHMAFALQAVAIANLDGVVFVPERNPRHKPGVEHFAHRVAMLKQAVRPYPNMAVLELVDRHFTVQRTWPQLEAIFAGTTLVMLMGSDATLHIPYWPRADRMLKNCELAIGVREHHELADITAAIATWPTQPKQMHIFESYAPDVSSSAVRIALQQRRQGKGLLRSVQQYASQNWLYISLENS